jgi:hypothetical protein
MDRFLEFELGRWLVEIKKLNPVDMAFCPLRYHLAYANRAGVERNENNKLVGLILGKVLLGIQLTTAAREIE